MYFGPCTIDEAEGTILAHAVVAARLRFKKGRRLSAKDIEALKDAGVEEVVVARLDAHDVAEDEAAGRLSTALAGTGVRIGAAFTGRSNLYATDAGLALVDAARVDMFNAVDEAITLATVSPFARVQPRQLLATVKIIPFAAPDRAVAAAESIAAGGPTIRVVPFRPRRVALVSTALPHTKPQILDKTRAAVGQRIESIGSKIVLERRTNHEIGPLADAIEDACQSADLVLVFGASAITDRCDVIPSAIERAGGVVSQFGMPVDPGNLLLLGNCRGVTVVGLPGCARSPKLNGFDFVLWRLAAGLEVGRADIAAMGVGGLLTEIPTRPQPRDERPYEPPRMARIGAVILAAGLSSRMGSNKLLAEVGGKPMVRLAAEAALGSAADPVIVVTGNGRADVEAALDGLHVRTVNNPDFAKGLSTSLKCGLNALPDDCDGALIMLADMPGVGSKLVDRLVAAFDPAENRAICLPAWKGRRGNPVLWARRFFPEILALEGDLGARQLIGLYDELVCEIEAEDESPLTDLDTPEELKAFEPR